MHIIHITLEYLRERQPPVVRLLHITILCLVLSQIIVSNFMEFTDNGEVSKKTGEEPKKPLTIASTGTTKSLTVFGAR